MKLTEIKDGEILKAYVCSRCGCVEFAGTEYPMRKEFSSSDFSRLPGWSTQFGSITLCPECTKDFHKMASRFINDTPHQQSDEIEVKENEHRP